MEHNEPVEKTAEETIALLSKWFSTVCKFLPPLANQLSSELVHQSGITEVEQFSMLQQIDPNWLDSLQCPMPTLAKILVKANVEKIGRTPLRSLDLEDVRGVVDSCLPEFPYGAIFKEKKISGFALSCVESVDALVEFGVTNTIHAAPLFASINEWKRIGVPNELIAENTLRNVHIKEEVQREMGRSRNSSQSVLATPSSEEAQGSNESHHDAAALTQPKKTSSPKKAASTHEGMGTSSDPVCFSDSDSDSDSEEEEMEVEIEMEVSAQTTSAVPPAMEEEEEEPQPVENRSNVRTEELVCDLGSSTDRDLDLAMHETPLGTDSGGTQDQLRGAGNGMGSGAIFHYQEQEQQQQQTMSENDSHEMQDLVDRGDEKEMEGEEIEAVVECEGEAGANYQRKRSYSSADSTADAAATTNSGTPTGAAPKRAKQGLTPALHFPGIPQSPGYAAVVEAIESTRPGKVVRLDQDLIDLLVNIPESAIQGHWEFQDMSHGPAHGYLSSGQQRQNKLREKGLVFIPASLRRADALVSPGRELIFVASDKRHPKLHRRSEGQELVAASSGDSSSEEDELVGEKRYGCRVRPGSHKSVPPKGESGAKVTQFLPELEDAQVVYTRPFPGIPWASGASPRRYAGIIEAIEASRPGKLIRVRAEDIQTLLLTPAEEIGGYWKFCNRWPLPDDCELSPTLQKQSVMLKNALVFVPHSTKDLNSISRRGAPARELVLVESSKKPSVRRASQEDQSASSGDSEAEVEGTQRLYGTQVPDLEQQRQQPHTRVVTHSEVALSTGAFGGRVDQRQTYAEHFQYGPYPGIPLHEELQAQYRPIVVKIESTRVGDSVSCSEEEVAMLLTLPEEFIGGTWMRTDRSQAASCSSRTSASDSMANSLRTSALVFVPTVVPKSGDREDTEIVILERKNDQFGLQHQLPEWSEWTLGQTSVRSSSGIKETSKCKSTKSPGAKAAPSIASGSSNSSHSAVPDAPATPTAPTSAAQKQKQATYGEHFGERLFPGIPQHPLLRAQYEDIVDRIRATQIGEAVLVTENQRDMLRAVPEELVQGRWMQQDTSYHLGRVDSLQGSKDMERRTKSLVFVASSSATPAELPYLERSNPATPENIVIVTSAPKKVKTASLEVVEPLRKKALAKAAAKTVAKPIVAKPIVAKPTAKMHTESAPGTVEVHPPSKAVEVLSVYSSSDSEGEHAASARSQRSSSRAPKRGIRSTASTGDEEDGTEESSGRPKRKTAGARAASLKVAAATSATSAPARRHSSAHETLSVSAYSATSAGTGATGRRSLGSASSSGGRGVQAQHEAVRQACHDALHSRDDKVISDAVKYLGDAAAKVDSYAVDYMLSMNIFSRLLHFVHLAPRLQSDKNSFVFRTLKTLNSIITRLDGFPQIELIFQLKSFGAILKQCLSTNGDVRQQALLLVSDIGVSDEGDIKQRVLSAGAVKTIMESFYNVSCFSVPSTRLRSQGFCVRCLYKLASCSTPAQFEYFVPALGLLREVLQSDAMGWEFLVEAMQAVNFFVVPNCSRQIDVLMEHSFLDLLVAMFSDSSRIPALRWHASLFIWSVAKYCDNAQMRKMLRLMGVLGGVFHLDHAHPHLRAAALNIMQVMLLRGESVIQQFVYHRDAIPANAMALVRDHPHEQLVHVHKRTSNCIVKYASFTLAHATAGANGEQLIRLLELGVYPLLFKIVSFEGEDAQPEEAKLKAVAALSHLLQEVPNEVKHYQLREERTQCVDFSIKWNIIRALVADRFELDEDEDSGEGSSSAVESKSDGQGDFVWSEELREKAQELLDMAREVDLV